MPIKEKVFWVMLTVFGAIFGTGIYFLFSPEPRPAHLILTVVGAIGMAATLVERKESESTERRLSILCTVAIVGLLINFIAISADIYGRYANVHDYSVMSAKWYAAMKNLPTTTGDLTGKVVRLDGRRFENCTLGGGTTLIWQGEEPFVLDCKPLPISNGGAIQVMSDNPVIQQMMALSRIVEVFMGGGIPVCQPPEGFSLP